ncbi:DUF3592 domain-containing protein [Thermopolyspora sp. NPDC052614]|uniref:DUF3592 domain-containing protein n=1 Tax=Thermopolyspora sp. NPDC052614 TaxID=3155682 RepID=UPI003438753D
MSERIVMPLVLGLVGLVFGLIGLWVLLSARNFKRRAVRAQGHVVALRPDRSGSDGVVYYPTVRFTTAYGQVVEAEANFGSKPAIGPVGHPVKVLYDPTNPVEYRIDSLWGRGTMFAAIFLGIGLVLLGAMTADVLSGG